MLSCKNGLLKTVLFLGHNPSIQKISKLDLEKEVSEVERKLAHAKKESIHQDKMFADLKSSGAGHGDVSRSGTDKLSTDIEQSKNDLKLTKALSERLASILLELQQSSNGLLQRLSPYSDIADIDDRNTNGGDALASTGGSSSNKLALLDNTGGSSSKQKTLVTTLDALNQSEQILAKMLETVTSGMDNNNIAAVVSAHNNNNNSLNSTLSSTFPFGNTNGLDSSSTSGDFNDTDTTINIRVKSLKMRRADEMAAINNNNALNAVVRQAKDTNSNGNSGAKSSAEARGNTVGGLEIPSRELVKNRSERRLNEEIQKIRREKKKNK